MQRIRITVSPTYRKGLGHFGDDLCRPLCDVFPCVSEVDPAGQGGQGTVGGGPSQNHGTGVDSTIFDPVNPGNVSDRIQVGIDGGTGEGDIVGRGDGPTQRGESIVPYAQVLPKYLNDAADSLSRLRLPPSMRGIVQGYFDRLASEVR